MTHMRQQHLDEALSPVTTPEDEKSVIRRIKHVAGAPSAKFPPEIPLCTVHGQLLWLR